MEKSVLALIGPPGSGKSAIGKKLAVQLNWQFLDTDAEIERLSGRTVADIFQTFGESEFREQERLLVKRLASSKVKNLVLATGGGLPVFGVNWQRLESFALVVYLTAPLEVLVTRINRGKERPLLTATDRDEQIAEVNDVEFRLGKLIAQRENIYNRAQYKIDTSKANIKRLADDIIRLTGLVLPSGL